MDGYAFLLASDQLEINIRTAIADRVARLMDERDQNLANRIANAVVKALGLADG